MKTMTTDPVMAPPQSGVNPEFGRIKDVERLFGIKRGTLYNLLNARKVSGLVLRVKGQKSGVRLIHLDSVRQFILSQMQESSNPIQN